MLSTENQVKVARVSGCFMFNLCKGTAMALKGTGYALEKSTGLAGSALHAAANAIETAGTVSSGVCYAGATYMDQKAEGYDLSGISDEEIANALGDEEDIVREEEASIC